MCRNKHGLFSAPHVQLTARSGLLQVSILWGLPSFPAVSLTHTHTARCSQVMRYDGSTLMARHFSMAGFRHILPKSFHMLMMPHPACACSVVPVMCSSSVALQLPVMVLILCGRCNAGKPLLAMQSITQPPQVCLLMLTCQARGHCLTTNVRCGNAGGCCDPDSVAEVIPVHCAEVTDDPVQKEGLQGSGSPSARSNTRPLAGRTTCEA